MRTAATVVLCLLCTAGAMDMNVNLSAGGAQTFQVEQIRKVTFDLAAPATMNVLMLGGASTPIELTAVRSITFTGTLTGINPRRAQRIKAQVTSFIVRRMGAAATLSFTLPEPEEVTVSVFGIDGSLVRTLTRGRLPAGEHLLVWDGKDGTGRTAASATYILRLDRTNEVRAFRFVTVR